MGLLRASRIIFRSTDGCYCHFSVICSRSWLTCEEKFVCMLSCICSVTDIWTRVWRSLAMSVQISPEAPVDFAAELLNIWMIFTCISIEWQSRWFFQMWSTKSINPPFGFRVGESQPGWLAEPTPSVSLRFSKFEGNYHVGLPRFLAEFSPEQ